MPTVAQSLGSEAERLVEGRLRDEGWMVLGRNVRVGRAEIDILAIDPTAAMLVAVEVRWRGRRDYGLPEETVGRAKLARLRAALSCLRTGAGATNLVVLRLPMRVDLVAVEPGGIIRHYRAIG